MLESERIAAKKALDEYLGIKKPTKTVREIAASLGLRTGCSYDPSDTAEEAERETQIAREGNDA